MEINVHPVPEIFYLATDKGWKRQVGHLVKVGKYKFSIVPNGYLLIVSEVKTGAKVFDVPIPNILRTHSETMIFFEAIGKSLRDKLEQMDHEELDNIIEQKYNQAIKMCGKKPIEI